MLMHFTQPIIVFVSKLHLSIRSILKTNDFLDLLLRINTFEMANQSIRAFCIVAILVLISINWVNAECCNQIHSVRHYCKESPGERQIKITKRGKKCISEICMDGQPISLYCSYGWCDASGCNCKQSCANNSLGTWKEAERIFVDNFGIRLYPKRSIPRIVNMGVIVHE